MSAKSSIADEEKREDAVESQSMLQVVNDASTNSQGYSSSSATRSIQHGYRTKSTFNLCLAFGLTLFIASTVIFTFVSVRYRTISDTTKHGSSIMESDGKIVKRETKYSSAIRYVVLYIMEHDHQDQKVGHRKISVPVVRLNAKEYESNDSLIFYDDETPIYEDQYTKHTIIFSHDNVFIFPSIENRNRQLFSIAELISNKNVSFFDHSGNTPIKLNIDSIMKTKKHSKDLDEFSFDPDTKTFDKSVHIDQQLFVQLKSLVASSYDDHYGSPSKYGKYQKDSDYDRYRRRRPPKTSTTKPEEPIAETLGNSILTQCILNENTAEKAKKNKARKYSEKMQMETSKTKSKNLIPMTNTYMIQFDVDSENSDNFEEICKCLHKYEKIEAALIKRVREIKSDIYSAVVFKTDVPLNNTIQRMPGAISFHQVYFIKRENPTSPKLEKGQNQDKIDDAFVPHSWTGVKRIHETFKNFGKGVKIAVIDSGVDYRHPALGVNFGPGNKVAFGYDLVGDRYSFRSQQTNPDPDPLDACSFVSHGTHVSGIIGADARFIDDSFYRPFAPFIGVAPEATLGHYRVFGCASDFTSTDIIVDAMMRAYTDGADIITISIGASNSYPDPVFADVSEILTLRGVYISVSAGNNGEGGLFTTSNMAISPGVMGVGSVDNNYAPDRFLILTPDGAQLRYDPGSAFGGWTTTTKSQIAVNDPNRGINDGCDGPIVPVDKKVVLFSFNEKDSCGSAKRCNLAAGKGAVGCLIYDVGPITGGSSIPSGSLDLKDGLAILKIVANKPDAIFTFTNTIILSKKETGQTMSAFSSYGLDGDLNPSPQISAPGGFIYSTLGKSAAEAQKLPTAYEVYSGTSMATPYMAGVLALFLASIGNPKPASVLGSSDNGICRPTFSKVMNLFQSNTRLINNVNTDLTTSVAWQGAGLVNAFQSLTATAFFSPSHLALNDTLRRQTNYKVKLINLGKKKAIYELYPKGAVLLTSLSKDQDQQLSSPVASKRYANVRIQPRVVEIDAGKAADITIQFEEPSNVDPTLLPIFSGYIQAKNKAHGQIVQMSYAGVIGNYQNAQIFVKKSNSGIKTGVLDNQGNYISEEKPPVINITQYVTVRTVTAWPTRILWVELVHEYVDLFPSWLQSFGLLYEGSPFYVANLPRNVDSDIVSGLLRSYDDAWNGLVIFFDQGEQRFHETRVPTGTYRIRFSALKHFGDPNNPNDIESYLSAPFQITY